MSKTVTNWFARSTGSKSLARESTTSLSGTKCSSVHPQETKERDAPLGNNTSSTGISNGIVDLKVLEKPEVVASADVVSSCDSEEEEEEGDQEEEEEEAATNQAFLQLELGPQVPLKEQLEKDKEDESLRRWKEQLLGSASLDDAAAAGGGDGGFSEPEVKVLRLGIAARGREELELPLPLTTNARGHTFSLKEGSHYQLKFVFTVRNNIVPGLTCINTVWKAGIVVDQTRSMLGTFAPQKQPYIHVMAQQVTPSGALARGPYSARTRFIDDDGTVYLDMNYSFEIRKDW
jgi:Rho GDP-dissociation inhibitor